MLDTSTVLLIFKLLIGYVFADKADDQLRIFKESTNGPIGVLTTDAGAPIYCNETTPVNENLIFNEFFMDSFFRFDRERIPERVVHAKGAGAHGYFIVKNNISNICRAKLFSKDGKKTKVFVRFSTDFTEKGGPDTDREVRGFAMKFYTEEGNFDLLNLSTEMFFLKDPAKFIHAIHALKRNPQTNLLSATSRWDYVVRNPESMFFNLVLFSDRGIPDGYRYMTGYPIHVFQVFNRNQESSFVKFIWTPDAGNRFLNTSRANQLFIEDRDYATRDLYNAIANENYPSWTLRMTVMSEKQVKEANFDVFDITRIWPKSIKSIEVGTLVLNRNPKNHFAEVEQAAFSPSNLVPGILGGIDNVFQGRRFSYKDTQVYRLGVNWNQLPINHPHSPVYTYNRDGFMVNDNEGNAPNYFSSYNGPETWDVDKPRLWRAYVDPEPNNFDQAGEDYDKMDAGQRKRLITTTAETLVPVESSLRKRALALIRRVRADYADRVEAELESYSK